jgi:hypothetical protein
VLFQAGFAGLVWDGSKREFIQEAETGFLMQILNDTDIIFFFFLSFQGKWHLI